MTQEFQNRFLAARRELIRRQFVNLNDCQQKAVLTTEGPLLLLAGAGSGKTTVLIHRIANLLRFGRGSDSTSVPCWITEDNVLAMEQALADGNTEGVLSFCADQPVAPWSIIAITFTNKAAGELKNRLCSMIGPRAEDVWAMTFHSACCRILRREIDRLGYDRNFTIYDTSDSERVMKEVIRDFGIDEKKFPARSVLNQISRAKDRGLFPDRYGEENEDGRNEAVSRCYTEYQNRLKEANALDFDDIILLTVHLLREYPEVREFYAKKFRYVLVDEYQDTNRLQYMLTSLLASGSHNICVVGDDDQSIYSFRGATIRNILEFENEYSDAKTIRLEQNYRSTGKILEAANAVIGHNAKRKGKRLWTQNGPGEPIVLRECWNETEEADFVSDRILSLSGENSLRDFAVLYRTNAQSNAIEKSFKSNGIRYRIIGGTRFFDRAEVRDMLAYMRVINNRSDTLRLNRIINTPPRRIGAKSLETAQRLADSAAVPLYDVISQARSFPALEKAEKAMTAFVGIIEKCAEIAEKKTLPEFYDALLQMSGYESMLLADSSPEGKSRLENVRELRSNLIGYADNHPDDASLAGFLEEVALYTDIDQYDADADAVVMMTMHAAKGLEFPHVFIVGAEDGLFPSGKSIGDEAAMEEERRLCYVAITRAKKTLAISYAASRMLYGTTTNSSVSRFVREIPSELLSAPVREHTAAYGFGNTISGMSGTHRSGTDGGTRYVPGFFEDSYAPERSAPQTPFRLKPEAPQQALLELKPGDSVTHTSFGTGMVISVMKMGADALWEIAFNGVGTKRLLGKTASKYVKKL